MADPDFLREGDCYFYMSYLDNNLFIPVIETYIYARSEVDENNDQYWLFLDADSHKNQATEPQYLGIDESNLSSILTISELGLKLKSLEHLHPLSGVVASKKITLTKSNVTSIKEQLKTITQSNDKESITIGSRFRDNGISLSMVNSAISIALFLDCKERPEEEIIVRSIFSKNGILPASDYLSQHERVRILSYIVETTAQAEIIISSIFMDAFGIYEHEQLIAS